MSLNFKFIIVPTFHEERIKGKSEPEIYQLCLIAVKHSERDRELIHQFSDFVLELKHKAYNTMKNRAESVVRFLNYVLQKDNLKSFSCLEIRNGENYLDHVRQNGCSKSYFLREAGTLTKFYYFLATKKLLDSKDEKLQQENFKWEKRKFNGKEIKVLASIFKDIRHPSSKPPIRPLHHIEEELICFLLELALRYTPRIALGLYFQMFGGLRPSEVVNLSTTCETLYGPNGCNGMTLIVMKRYFGDNPKPQRKSSGVKQPRSQNIEVFGDYLSYLWAKHLINYTPNDGTLALFSNTKGEWMRYGVYYYQFKKLIEKFIEILSNCGNTNYEIYATNLKMLTIGPHIGRGIFSNLMAEILDCRGLMLARGDRNPESSQVYIDNTKRSRNRVSTELNNMLKEGMESVIPVN